MNHGGPAVVTVKAGRLTQAQADSRAQMDERRTRPPT
jgi:hypothetical protein